jgi:hypothetical protein
LGREVEFLPWFSGAGRQTSSARAKAEGIFKNRRGLMPMKLIDKHSQMDPRSAWLRQFDETDRILAASTRPALDHCRFRLAAETL